MNVNAYLALVCPDSQFLPSALEPDANRSSFQSAQSEFPSDMHPYNEGIACAVSWRFPALHFFFQNIMRFCFFADHKLQTFLYWFDNMTETAPNEKRTPSEISFKKCSLDSKCCIAYLLFNYSSCVAILRFRKKNCCQFVVNSDLKCRKPA